MAGFTFVSDIRVSKYRWQERSSGAAGSMARVTILARW